MRLTDAAARARLGHRTHGVLCTVHPTRGPQPVPVMYALAGPDHGAGPDHVGIPVDLVKPKSGTRLQRERNLEADPRGSLLVEHWDPEDWSGLWWVRAELRHLPSPPPALVSALADQLARTVPHYADRPFDHLLVLRVEAVTGWSA
ncbi:pyridoxamine 5'-phosphate oxidase family protein [Granulicoccus phenolivorans]|uniref:pyridoxamine 5'-phosphate oxidase family protein n=1 Tax=Granulicoccus phenolivorans TaxID=266854 RepID=UPI00047DE042|nr:pyridoxamine 5'-phosphate oxidase family protein [Granulicoccus phenolivorans]